VHAEGVLAVEFVQEEGEFLEGVVGLEEVRCLRGSIVGEGGLLEAGSFASLPEAVFAFALSDGHDVLVSGDLMFGSGFFFLVVALVVSLHR
jgi:hypothetical protein